MATNEGEASKRQRNNERGDADTDEAGIGHPADDQKFAENWQNVPKGNSQSQPVNSAFKVINLEDATVEEWVFFISDPYDSAKDDLIDTGSRLIQAEQKLDHKNLTEVYERLGFSSRRAQQLKDLYRHFGNLNADKLPNADRALKELKKLDHKQLEQAIQQGEIHRGLKSEDAQAVVQRYRGEITQAATSSQTANYKLGHLRRLITTFETVSDDEFQDMIERLRDDEREKLRRTLEALERHLEARHGADKK